MVQLWRGDDAALEENGPVAKQETDFSRQQKDVVADTSFMSARETGRQHLNTFHQTVFVIHT